MSPHLFAAKSFCDAGVMRFSCHFPDVSRGGRIYDHFGPRPLAIPGAVVWTASIRLLSTLDESSGAGAFLAACLVMSAHGSAAFTAAQQLAGAAGGAVLVSAYTIGSNSMHAGALSVAQTVSAGQAAFTTAGIIAFGALPGTLALGNATNRAAIPRWRRANRQSQTPTDG